MRPKLEFHGVIGKFTDLTCTPNPLGVLSDCRCTFLKVVVDQTGNMRSEDGEVERAPGNRQQKHMFVE